MKRSLPASVAVPLQAEAALVERVRSISASDLEPRLAPLAFELWLFSALQRYIPPLRDPFVTWSLTFCAEPNSAFPKAGPDLCVHAKVLLVDERLVNVHVRVAAGSTSRSGHTGWKEVPPTVQDIYVERLDPDRLFEQGALDSLDVKTLADLESRVPLPFNQWPTVDFESTVTRLSAAPQNDSLGHFRISVRNRGRRDADRAAVTVLLSIPQQTGERKEIRRQWFPRIPAGQTVTLDISADLPRGDAMVIVSTGTTFGFKRVREVNPDDNTTAVHFPSTR